MQTIRLLLRRPINKVKSYKFMSETQRLYFSSNSRAHVNIIHACMKMRHNKYLITTIELLMKLKAITLRNVISNYGEKHTN